MVDSSPNSIQNFNPIPRAPSPSSLPQTAHYDDVSGPLRPPTALSLPEPGPSDEIEELETEAPYNYPARRLPNLNFTPTHEGSLLSSIHTRISALRSTAADAQAQYSQAINSSIPQDPVTNRNVRMTIANVVWNSTAFFEEEEAAAQLLRYREMFTYLSQLHAESLAGSSLYQAQNLVRRGQISVAAIRLTGDRSQRIVNHSIAQGHHARHSSEVSVWGWKPWREIALAEKISERRRQRVEKEREKRRERPSGERRSKSPRNSDDRASLVYGEDLQTRTLRKTTRGRIKNRVHYSDVGSADTEYGISESASTDILTPNSERASLCNAGPLTDGATSREKLVPIPSMLISDAPGPPGWHWSVNPKNEITWRIPVYHGSSSQSLTTSSEERNIRLMQPTIATVTNASDMFQRIHTINEPSGMEYISSSSSSGLGPGISPQISPKSQVSPNISSRNDTSTMSTDEPPSSLPSETIATSLSQQPSVSFKKVLLEHHRKKADSGGSSSGSTVGASRSKDSLKKIKRVFKSIPLKNVHFPWSSSSEEEGHISADSSLETSSSEQSWLLNNRAPPDYGLVPVPAQQRYFTYGEYLDDPTPETRIHSPHTPSPQPKSTRKRNTIIHPLSPPHPGTKFPKMILVSDTTLALERDPLVHKESDPLTRTEKEYQEVLTALDGLKREMRAEKRKDNRGRRRVGDKR